MNIPDIPRGLSGIYQIKNIESGHRYIGSSIDINRRLLDHASHLRRNSNECSHLQNAYNKYGDACFECQILLLCPENKTLYYEQAFLDRFHPRYNIARSVTAPTLGLKYSEKTRKKMSRSQSGKNNPMYGKSPSKIHRERISAALSGEKNSFYGKTHSKETRQLLSEQMKQRWADGVYVRTAEHNRKIGEGLRGNQNAKGLKFSEEHKRKISEALKGMKRSEETKRKISESRKKMFAQRRLKQTGGTNC